MSVDTMALIWGVRGGGSDDQKDMEHRARVLFSLLAEDHCRIIVPTVVIAELLTPVPIEKHGQLLIKLQQLCIPAPFDLQAASKAAEIWSLHKQLGRGDRSKRSVLKADALIVATAATAGATVFYSHDRTCRRLATLAGLSAKDLPTHDENMFRDNEARL